MDSRIGFLKNFLRSVADAARLDILIRCLDSSLVECTPATQDTCLSRDALLKDGERLGQVSP